MLKTSQPPSSHTTSDTLSTTMTECFVLISLLGKSSKNVGTIKVFGLSFLCSYVLGWL